jgi:hypothetical protein
MRRLVGGSGADGADWPPCVTVTVRPATVNVPVRAAVDAGTVKLTEPMPDPVAPAVIVIQLVVVVADQEQLVPDVTANVPALPFVGTVTVVGVTV